MSTFKHSHHDLTHAEQGGIHGGPRLKSARARALVSAAWIVGPPLTLLLADFIHGGREFVTAMAKGEPNAFLPFAVVALAASVATGANKLEDVVRMLRRILRRPRRNDAEFQQMVRLMIVEATSPVHRELQTLKDGFDYLRRILENRSAASLKDTAEVWRDFVVRMDSINPTLRREAIISPVSGGAFYRISCDPERVYGNILGRFRQRMYLNYVVYAPRKLGFGTHPAEVLLRLVHIVRCCRKRANAEGMKFKATVRILLIDEPRRTGCIFSGYRKLGDGIAPLVFEYFRGMSSSETSPTGESLLFQHTDEQGIRQVCDYAESEAKRGVEIGIQTLERILRPLLPDEDGGVAPTITMESWNQVMDVLYSAGIGRTEFDVTTSDGFACHERLSSLEIDRTIDSELTLTDPTVSPAITLTPAKDGDNDDRTAPPQGRRRR